MGLDGWLGMCVWAVNILGLQVMGQLGCMFLWAPLESLVFRLTEDKNRINLLKFG